MRPDASVMFAFDLLSFHGTAPAVPLTSLYGAMRTLGIVRVAP